jgi:hypothetical protein
MKHLAWPVRSSGIWEAKKGSFFTDVSGKPIDPVFKSHAGQNDLKELFLDCSTLEDGTDGLYRNVGKKLPFYAA